MDQRINHFSVLRRAADRSDYSLQQMRKCVRDYLDALGSYINEADPEKDINIASIGMLRIRKHKAHMGRDVYRDVPVKVPAHRSIRLDPSPRIDYLLKAPIKKIGYSDES